LVAGRKVLLFAGYDNETGPASVMRKAVASGSVAEAVGSPWGNPPRTANLLAWSRDGKYVVATLSPAGYTGADIWMAPLNPPGEKAHPYLQSNANENGPNISPSSDWMAYSSDETRRFEVYVQSFPTPGRKYQVSVNGGSVPVWSRDGKELFFIAPDRKMMSVTVRKNGGDLEFGTPQALFDSRISVGVNASFDVAKDGRFLIPVQDLGGKVPMTLVFNWQAGLKK
jgi:eukaryotic-like serine/threonine-protein kinase